MFLSGNYFHLFRKLEEFEDTKGIIRIRKSKKNRQHNGQKKRYKGTNNDRVKRTPQTPGVNSCSPEGKAMHAPLVAHVVLI